MHLSVCFVTDISTSITSFATDQAPIEVLGNRTIASQNVFEKHVCFIDTISYNYFATEYNNKLQLFCTFPEIISWLPPCY